MGEVFLSTKCEIEDVMIVLISVEGCSVSAPVDLPVIVVAKERPVGMRGGDVFLPADEKGRGERLRKAFAFAFDKMGADGVITLPNGGLQDAELPKIGGIAEALQKGADFVDGNLEGGSPFLFGGLFRILTSFTTGSRRAPWCGLRGYSKNMAPLLDSVKAKGDEYETVLLQAAVTDGVKVTDLGAGADVQGGEAIPRASRGSFRGSFFGAWGIFMYSTSLKFLFSAVIAFLVDYILLLALAPLIPLGASLSRGVAKVLSWVCSSQTNFHLNRLLVFRKTGGLWSSMLQYYSLAGVVLLGKVVGVMVLGFIPLWLANLICEATFFVLNYFVQKKLIFKKK
jgi:putative flippase GtrA